MKISELRSNNNPNYLGYDENHNGDFDEYFKCPKCGYNYILIYDEYCGLCGKKIEWVNQKKNVKRI